MKKISPSLLIIVFFLFWAETLFSQTVLWQYSAGGDLRALMKEGADGSLYLLAEDKALHSIAPETGLENWLYRPEEELAPVIICSPDGSLFLLSGNQIHCLSPSAHRKWEKEISGETIQLLGAGADAACYFRVNDQIVRIDRRGDTRWTLPLEYSLEEILIHPGGVVLLRDESGISGLNAYSGELLWRINGDFDSCLLYTDFFRVLQHNLVIDYSYLGYPRKENPLSAFSGESMFSRDNDYQCAVYSSKEGVILYPENRIVYQGPSDLLLGFFIDNSLILKTGNAINYSRDNFVKRIFTGEVLQQPLIAHDNQRIYIFSSLWLLKCLDSSFLPAPADSPLIFGELQAEFWFDDLYPEFGGYIEVAREGNTESKKRLLRELESLRQKGLLEETIPYYSLLLSALSFTESPTGNRYDYVLNSSVELRSAVYQMISDIDDYRLREIIISRMKTETDTAVLSAAVQALGQLGTDYDGRGSEALYRLLNRIEDPGNRLAIEIIRCLINFGKHEGSFPQAMNEIVKKIMNLPLNVDARTKIRDIFSAELK